MEIHDEFKAFIVFLKQIESSFPILFLGFANQIQKFFQI
jgi:hypothetical protein